MMSKIFLYCIYVSHITIHNGFVSMVFSGLKVMCTMYMQFIVFYVALVLSERPFSIIIEYTLHV